MAQNDTFCPEMLSALQNANSILLCTHVAPDGDAIGSTLAMGLALEALGKRVTLACADPVPAQFLFLPGADRFVQPPALKGQSYDAALAIDAADRERVGACGEAFDAAKVTLQMDHHPGNPRYADYNAVDGEAAAAGCVVRRALRALHIPLSRETALCLYCAISTDTGNFCFRNTSAEAFSIMAEVMETGLDLPEAARKIHLLREEPHVRLLGRALNTLRFFAAGKCACMTLTQADYQAARALPEHNTQIINYAMNIPGVEMCYLAEEREQGFVKTSLRCQPPRDVSVIARKFGGGGHVFAAAFRCEGSLAEVCSALEQEMLRQLEEGK